MTYARIENNTVVEYPVYEEAIRLRYPNMSFPRDNFEPPEEYVKVDDTAPPQITYMEMLSEGIPTQYEDGWKRNWVVEPVDDEVVQRRIDNQWLNVRTQRNRLLQQSDWIVTKSLEASGIVPLKWVEYRQALRDITLQEDPFNIVWPNEPTL